MMGKAVIIAEDTEILSAFAVTRPRAFMPGRFIQFIDGDAYPAVTNSNPFYLVIRYNEGDFVEQPIINRIYGFWNDILVSLLYIECIGSVKLLNSTELWRKHEITEEDIGKQFEITDDFKGKLQVLREDEDKGKPIGIIEKIELVGECEYVQVKFLPSV